MRLRAQHRVRLEEQQQRPSKRAPEARRLLVVEVRVPVERLVHEHAVHLVPTQPQRAGRHGARQLRRGQHGVGVPWAVEELDEPEVDRQHRTDVGQRKGEASERANLAEDRVAEERTGRLHLIRIS